MNKTAPKPQPVIVFDHIAKIYGTGGSKTHAVKNATFEIEPASFTVIVGPSGSGKSTILNLMGLLDQPTKGEYWLDGLKTADISSDNQRAILRRDKLGFVFQQFNLLSRASALQNVMMPGIYSRKKNRQERATYLLKEVGLSHRLHHRPNQMSGGEQQRVAIARSLINSPRILLADEPTGNLDSKTGKAILELLQELNRNGQTVVVITHDDSLADLAHKVIRVKDGVTS
ncbi:ABC transporter ATP-binding protein [Candidatus Berkelbacteria bacterium]|nr:ABC transporter ATP-binding protein [Candidatus Berkelbacteria bacterium]